MKLKMKYASIDLNFTFSNCLIFEINQQYHIVMMYQISSLKVRQKYELIESVQNLFLKLNKFVWRVDEAYVLRYESRLLSKVRRLHQQSEIWKQHLNTEVSIRYHLKLKKRFSLSRLIIEHLSKRSQGKGSYQSDLMLSTSRNQN